MENDQKFLVSIATIAATYFGVPFLYGYKLENLWPHIIGGAVAFLGFAFLIWSNRNRI